MNPQRLKSAALAGFLAAGVAIGFTLAKLMAMDLPRAVEWLDRPRPVAPFELQTSAGKFDRKALYGGWHLLLLGYTRCPDVCPTSLAALARLVDEVRDIPLRVVFVSVDPERDSPADINSHAIFFHPGFVGATGAEDDLKALANSLGAQFLVEGDTTVRHSTTISLVGPGGQLQGRLRKGFDPISAARDIDAMVGGRP